jgi:protein-disulfide isomerase
VPRRRFLVSLLAAAALAVACFAAAPAAAADEAPLSAAEKQEIEKLIHDYLMENPEVVLESVRKHREAQEKAAQAEAEKNLGALKAQLVSDPHSPVGGNPEGDVTVVEFFDYRCGYCKRAHPGLKAAIEKDGNVRLVYKEFPILGDASVFATRAALAAWLIDKQHYEAFHDALMSHRGDLTPAKVLALATDAGLDPEAVKAKMEEPMVDGLIDANMRLAQALNINGTPAFVVGDELVPGYIEQERIEALIEKAREG